MARFAAPLCFNFLHVIRMNDVESGGQVRPRLLGFIARGAIVCSCGLCCRWQSVWR